MTQYAFIIFAAVCACLYFLFLCVMIFKVFWNIRGKRAAIPTMSRARQLQYQVRKEMEEMTKTRVSERSRAFTSVHERSRAFMRVDESW